MLGFYPVRNYGSKRNKCENSNWYDSFSCFLIGRDSIVELVSKFNIDARREMTNANQYAYLLSAASGSNDE